MGARRQQVLDESIDPSVSELRANQAPLINKEQLPSDSRSAKGPSAFHAMSATSRRPQEEVVMGKSILLMIDHYGSGPLRGALSRTSEILYMWRDRYRGRRELARLSDQDLHDIGRSWSDIADEVDKPFWRP
jgi:uncharacterized protein YjiS (DUF1127 family)